MILGVGLAMLEKYFLDDAQDPGSQKTGDRTSRKRRKPEAPAPAAEVADMLDDDDDDDDEFYPAMVQGKKPKLGTGYAGDAREDV